MRRWRLSMVFPLNCSELPEDVVKAAAISAMSPFDEPVTLHVVGVGAHGLTRDPLRGFCRLVQSGRSGLEWRIKEHATRTDFRAWLEGLAKEETQPQLPMVIGKELDREERHLCALAGGVAWNSLFVAEPLEQLRRWTHPVVSSIAADLNEYKARERPESEVIAPLPVEED